MSQLEANSNTTPMRKVHWLLKLFLSILGIALLGLFLLCYVSLYGRVNGKEFAAETFTRRQYTYLEFPPTHWQITPITRIEVTTELEKYLVAKELIAVVKPSSDKPTRWDLISSSSLDPNSPLCDAGILCTHLDRSNSEGEYIWLAWSKENPELAKLLWPQLAKLARQNLYVIVPDLLEVAKGVVDAKDFQHDINRLLGEKYLFLANNAQKLKQHQQAVDWYTETLLYRPDNEEAKLKRAISQKALKNE